MNVELQKFNNNWYKPDRNKLTQLLWYYVSITFINSYLIPISSFKVFILRVFGAKIGRNVNIKPKVNIKYPWKLEVGDYSWIGEKVWIDNLDTIIIGNNCCISQEAFLLCGNHNYKKPTFDLIINPIVLKDGVWIGAKSIVCPGVIANENVILTVGSVATGRLEANSIYKGNPAIKIKNRI